MQIEIKEPCVHQNRHPSSQSSRELEKKLTVRNIKSSLSISCNNEAGRKLTSKSNEDLRQLMGPFSSFNRKETKAYSFPRNKRDQYQPSHNELIFLRGRTMDGQRAIVPVSKPASNHFLLITSHNML